MNKSLKEKVLKGAEFIKNGDPLKDVMDNYEIMDAIVEFAKILKNKEEEVSWTPHADI
jgi:hypothetical protein